MYEGDKLIRGPNHMILMCGHFKLLCVLEKHRDTKIKLPEVELFSSFPS